MTEGR
jgi:hypothetical protein